MDASEVADVLPLIGAVVFILVFLRDGATRPGYDPRRLPVSALALGPRGWIQTVNFLQLGAALMAGAGVALSRSVPAAEWSTSLWSVGVLLLGAGVLASGLFRMDPMRGYPPGAPEDDPSMWSWGHRWHDAAGSVVFLGIPVLLVGVVAVWNLSAAVRIAAVVAGVGTGWLAVRFGERWEQDAADAGLWQRAHLMLGLPSLGTVALVVW